ncbi:MAG: hypothetical protein ACXU7D_06245, partial [Burkholderiaceae bacterium]
VGDRYSMRHIDKNIRGSSNTNEVVIGAIQKDGSLISADKLVTLRADGTPRRMANPDGTFAEWSDTYVDRLPVENLFIGHKQKVNWIHRYKQAEGESKQIHTGTIEVTGIETVHVPAGQFRAYKIVRRTNYSENRTWMASEFRGTLKVTSWYAPSIRAIVASEVELERIYIGITGNTPRGSLPDRYRDELTAYQVAQEQPAQKN